MILQYKRTALLSQNPCTKIYFENLLLELLDYIHDTAMDEVLWLNKNAWLLQWILFLIYWVQLNWATDWLKIN